MTGRPDFAVAGAGAAAGSAGGGAWSSAAAAKALAAQAFSSSVSRDAAPSRTSRRVSTLATQAGRARSITTRDLPGPNRPNRNALTSASALPP